MSVVEDLNLLGSHGDNLLVALRVLRVRVGKIRHEHERKRRIVVSEKPHLKPVNRALDGCSRIEDCVYDDDRFVLGGDRDVGIELWQRPGRLQCVTA